MARSGWQTLGVIFPLLCLLVTQAPAQEIMPSPASPLEDADDPVHRIIDLEARLILDPDESEIREQLSRLLIKAALFERALAHLEPLLQDDLEVPDLEETKIAAALSAFTRYDEALDIGRLFLAAGNPSRASIMLEEMQELFPACPLTDRFKEELDAGLLAERKQYDEVLALVVQYLKGDLEAMSPLDEAGADDSVLRSLMSSLMGRGYLKARDYFRARARLEEAIRLDEQNATAWSLLGRCDHNQGFLAQSLEAYGQARRWDPEDPREIARLNGVVFLMRGAREQEPLEPSGLSCGLEFLSWASEEEEPAPAAQEMRKALEPEVEKPKIRKKKKKEKTAEGGKNPLLKRLLIGGAVGGGIAAFLATKSPGVAEPLEDTGTEDTCGNWSGGWSGTLNSSPRCASRIAAGTFSSSVNVVQDGTAVKILLDRLPPVEGLACLRPDLLVPRSDSTSSYETSWTCLDPEGNVYRFRWSGEITCASDTLRWDSTLSADRNEKQWCTWDLTGTYTRR